MTSEAASELLQRCFGDALGHGAYNEAMPSPADLVEFYEGMDRGARHLANSLGISDDVSNLLRAVPPRAQRGGYFFSAAARAVMPRRVRDVIEWLNRGTEADDCSLLVDIAEAAVPEAELNAKVAEFVGGLRAMSEAHGLPFDAAALAKVRLTIALHLLLPTLPNILALIIGLSERARNVPLAAANRRPNFRRGLLRELFSGLVAAHVAMFGREPQLQNSTRDPEGPGVVWARQVLQHAAKRIPGAIGENLLDPHHEREAIAAIKDAASMGNWSLATRLRNGLKDLRERPPG
jgi:hypothetical protein